MGVMQNYVMHCDVRSWQPSGLMCDTTHCNQHSNNDWQDSLVVFVDEYLVDSLLKAKVYWDTLSEIALDKFMRWNWRLFLRDRGAKASGLTEGIRSYAQVEFCSQLGKKRPLSQDCGHEHSPGDLAEPHRWTAIRAIHVQAHQPSRFPLYASWTSGPAAQWRWTIAHISRPFMLCIGKWWWLIESQVKEGKCVLQVARLSPNVQKHKRRSEKPPLSCLAVSNWLSSRCWISR